MTVPSARLAAHVVRPPAGDPIRVLREEAGPRVDLTVGPDPGADRTLLVDGVPSADLLDRLPALDTLVIPWAGLPAATRSLLLDRPRIRVHNLHHNAAPAAEMALALALAAAKTLVPLDAELRRGDWSSRPRHDLALGLAGRSAVVWGAGAIGTRVATAAEALGLEVARVGRTARAGVHPASALDGLLPRAQLLFVCVPLTPETRGRLDAAALARLPPDAILVNVGRGAVVDEDALYEALASRRLFGAGLDVWWHYPGEEGTASSPSRLPFADLPNVVFSPHRGGHVKETEPLRMRALGAMLRTAAEGRPLPHAVDPGRGY